MKFSVIVPVYNVEKYISKCVDSLLMQSFEDYEIIFVNDFSTDDSEKIIKEKTKALKNVKLINNKRNLGLSDTRNNGIKVARGDYLLFVDSDDYIENNMLSRLNASIVKNDMPDIVYFGFIEEEYGRAEKMRGFKAKCGIKYDSCEFIKRELAKKNLFAPVCFAAYKRSFIMKKNLFFTSKMLHEDELWTPITLLSAKTVYLDEGFYYHYVRHSGTITRLKDTTNNGISLKQIAIQLDKNANYISDYELKKLMRGHVARLYMRSMTTGRLYRGCFDREINRCFPIKRADCLYDRIRALIFFFSPRLYYGFFKIITGR